MKTWLCLVVLGGSVCLFAACAGNPPPSSSHKKLKLETVDHGPMRPKTYLYREVNE